MHFDPNKILLDKIKENGGFCNAHCHLDRAYTVTEQNMKDVVNNHLHVKWLFVDDYKHKATKNIYYNNISKALVNQISCGTTSCLSFVDLDYVSGFRAVEAANQAKEDFKDQIDFKIACQTLKGVIDKKCYNMLFSALEYDLVDIIGSLPGYDRGNEDKHLDIIMILAKRFNRRVHVHVDQLNTGVEKETELLARKTMQHGLEGMVTAVHSISLAAHPKSYRKEVYKMSQDAGLSFITCPTAWIDSRRTEELAPIHNSVTPVDELLEHDLVVAIGSDNIHDVYKPFSTGDMSVEIKFLLESLHIYDIDSLVKISTDNGLKVIGAD
jgi:cytosine/creatinine deaminase